MSESVPLARCPTVTARVLAHLALPAFENVPEPVCEELEHGYLRGGPSGARGKGFGSRGRGGRSSLVPGPEPAPGGLRPRAG